MAPERGTKVIEAALALQGKVDHLRSNGQLESETLGQLRREWGFVQVHESAAIEGNELNLNETRMAILQCITISGKPPKHSMEARHLHEALQYLESLAQTRDSISEREIREMAYHQGDYYCLREDGGGIAISREQSDFVLANTFATEVFRGWFG